MIVAKLFRARLVAMALENLYERFDPKDASNYYNTGEYEVIYDFYIENGAEINIPEEEKKKIRAAAIEKYNRDHPEWIKKGSKEFNRKKLQAVYKSFLIKKYLLEKTHTEIIVDENDNQVKPIKLWLK